MSLSDTAEYWNDVKRRRDYFPGYVHVKNLDCSHRHRIESNELAEIDCKACLKKLEDLPELKQQLLSNNGKRLLRHRKKKGFRLTTVVKFGKYKGNTIQWIWVGQWKLKQQ